MRMKLFLSMSLILLIFFSCKSSLKVASNLDLKLIDNKVEPFDISILYPGIAVPRTSPEYILKQPNRVIGHDPAFDLKKLLELKYWPALKDILDEDTLIEVFSFLKNKGRTPLALKMPVSFAPDTEVDFLEDHDRWRIVSFRFVPCPYKVLEKQKCTPEIRLVSQPYIGKTRKEWNIGDDFPDGSTIVKGYRGIYHPSDNWVFGDHSLHLFFRLDKTQSSRVIEELRKISAFFKQTCNTQHLPFGVHPCLIAQPKIVNGLTFSQSLYKILKDYAVGNHLHKVAMMTGKTSKYNENSTTALNVGPWAFRQIKRHVNPDGVVVGKFKVDIITTVKKVKEKGGEMVYARKQIFFRGASTASKKPADIERVFPNSIESPRSLDAFLITGAKWQDNDNYVRLLKERGGRQGFEEPNSMRRAKDLVPVLDRVENPNLSNEFNTSCVSCHVANNERYGLYKDFGDVDFQGSKYRFKSEGEVTYPKIDAVKKPMADNGRV